jgi:3-methyladenine DNA glycosylase AlkD
LSEAGAPGAGLTAADAVRALEVFANPGRSRDLGWFFKTGPGEYAEGDIFMGAKVPEVRKVAVEFAALPLAEVEVLAHSPIHEERLLADVLLVNRYKKAKHDATRGELFEMWLRLGYEGCWNNWDLVDVAWLFGDWLISHPNPALLDSLAGSSVLWERRMAVLLTFAQIKIGKFDDCLRVAGLLHEDSHDLIHKAVGWMLREVGKVEDDALREYLDETAATMPRTMLRYAIEKQPEALRQHYLGLARAKNNR